MHGELSFSKGREGEHAARKYLEQQGLTFVAQNYHCRRGELDLVMRDGEQWVFVEVKFRKNTYFADPEASFHASKRRKMEAAIAMFMQVHELHPDYTACRIDMVAIRSDRIAWYQNV
ncbi:YraN family protein [Aestuariibacter salexigens]|uniref:YraN family protein n=1 Tax=Aestuariibacter salexigens TaxID=226010 RepID=UPI000405D0B0|nr:YraN family protein [Aestuariibacter salexigens]